MVAILWRDFPSCCLLRPSKNVHIQTFGIEPCYTTGVENGVCFPNFHNCHHFCVTGRIFRMKVYESIVELLWNHIWNYMNLWKKIAVFSQRTMEFPWIFCFNQQPAPRPQNAWVVLASSGRARSHRPSAFRLLQVSPEEARRVICAPKEVVEEFQEEAWTRGLDRRGFPTVVCLQWELGVAEVQGLGGEIEMWKVEKHTILVGQILGERIDEWGLVSKEMDGWIGKFFSKVRYLLTEEDPVQWEDSGSLREAPRIFTILASEAFRASCTTASWQHYLHRIPEVFLRIPKSSLWKDPGSFHCHLFCGKVNMFADAQGALKLYIVICGTALVD